jgi:hypothetical protein
VSDLPNGQTFGSTAAAGGGGGVVVTDAVGAGAAGAAEADGETVAEGVTSVGAEDAAQPVTPTNMRQTNAKREYMK